MTDTTLLEQLVKTSGLKKKSIAERMNLSPYGLQKKIENESQFNAGEIEELCIVLKVSSLKMRDRIFFAKKDDLKSSEIGA